MSFPITKRIHHEANGGRFVSTVMVKGLTPIQTSLTKDNLDEVVDGAAKVRSMSKGLISNNQFAHYYALPRMLRFFRKTRIECARS